MPSPFFAAIKPCSASPILLSLSLIASSVMLSGCGGSNPTTRTNSDDRVVTPVQNNFKLTLQSPVRLINVEARVIDPQSGRVLHQSVITDDDQIIVDLKRADVPSQRLMYVELRPVGVNQSQYYDPILDKIASFNVPLRTMVQSVLSNQNILIDAYSEIAFQRAQVRSGWLNSRDDVSQLGLINLSALNAATSEVSSVFTVRRIVLPLGLSSRNELQSLTVSTNQSIILDYFRFSLGHVQHYFSQNAKMLRNIDSP